MRRFSFLFAVISLALVARPAAAQRCVAAGDMADNAAQNRYCGVPLITTALDGTTPLGGTAGFGTDTSCMAQNDDGSSPSLNISAYFTSGLRFFSATPHTSLFVNTNGNITFSGPEPTFTPEPFPVADRPMIAPFWADVDIRNADGSCTESVGTTCTACSPCAPFASNQIWWAFEPGRAVFTWDEVGYYSCGDDRRMSFQLILTEVTDSGGCGGGAGDFDVEFRFNRCEWDTGTASGGTGGFMDPDGGDDFCFLGTCFESGAPCPTGVCPPAMTAAQSGFDAGNGADFVEIPNSRVTRTITRTLCEESNVAMPGIWQFQIRSGGVVCPGAGEACTVAGVGGACAMGRTNCVGAGTECVQQVFAEDERCDSVDNDCDGTPDDGTNEALCGAGYACRDGACVEDCFESSCPVGLSCATSGVCVEPGCEDVDCEEGERCRAGACVDACDGVTCPHGQICTAGRCVNPCLGLTCDDCSVCDLGTCDLRCTMGGTCAAGEACDPATGGCVPAGCAGVSCSTGMHCVGGSCVDSCGGVTCPPGQTCSAGACRAIPRPDAGVPIDGGGPSFTDTGVGPIDGSVPGFDGGFVGTDAGRGPPTPMSRGCNCHVGSRSGSTGLGLGLLSLALVLVARRRR